MKAKYTSRPAAQAAPAFGQRQVGVRLDRVRVLGYGIRKTVVRDRRVGAGMRGVPPRLPCACCLLFRVMHQYAQKDSPLCNFGNVLRCRADSDYSYNEDVPINRLQQFATVASTTLTSCQPGQAGNFTA
ncbi:MAG: hypothetical protein EOP73_28900 [Variovorax sp.]|nr:MAG: hypothetical protein EOP73_28900 [Variovorax sp.]